MSRRGIALIDLIGAAPAGAEALLPDEVRGFLDRLAVVNHRSITTDTAFIHFGAVRADVSALPRLDGSRLAVEANEIERGIPFRLLFRRRPQAPADNVEPLATAWQLDLLLDPLSIKLPWFEPAQFVPAEGVLPARVEPLPAPGSGTGPPGTTDEPRLRTVRLNVSGVYRIESRGTGVVNRQFVDYPDPFDPDAPTGAVVKASFEPAHFFMGSLGVSVDRLTFDFSNTFTPPAAVARGHGPEWRGLILDRARLFPPWTFPFLGRFSVGIQELLIGSPFGMQGEVEVEFERRPSASQDPLAGTVQFFRSIDGTEQLLPAPVPAPPEPGSERLFQVSLGDHDVGQITVRGHLPTRPLNTQARWRIPGPGPDPDEFSGPTTPRFAVSSGNRVELTTSRPGGNGEGAGGQATEVSLGTLTFEFVSEAADPQPPFAPRIGLFRDETELGSNVVYVSGSRDVLEGLEFRADATEAAEDLRWTSGIGAFVQPGPRFRITGLPRKAESGVYFITLNDAADRTRQVVIEILDDGALVIGSEEGVRAEGQGLRVSRLRNEWDLFSFHQVGGLRRTEGGTRIVDGSAEVPAGVIAEVGLRPGDPERSLRDEPGPEPEPPASGKQETVELLQILMDFDETTRVGWGMFGLKPRSGPEGGFRAVDLLGANDETSNDVVTKPDPDVEEKGMVPLPKEIEEDLEAMLGRWAADIIRGDSDGNPRFHVLGRVDDVGPVAHNRRLARDRAEELAGLIRQGFENVRENEDLPDIVITSRGELDDPTDEAAKFEDGLRPHHRHVYALEQRLGLPSADLEPLLGTPHRLVDEAWGPITSMWTPKLEAGKNVGLRPAYRRVDIFAHYAAEVGAADGDEPTNAGDLATDPLPGTRRALVPGEDAPKPTEPLTPDPSYPHLMRATVAWDSPEIETGRDRWPTKLELVYRWVNEGILLPDPAAPDDPDSKQEQDLLSCKPSDAGPLEAPEIFTILLRGNLDVRTREIVITGSIESEGSERGLVCLESNPLAPVMTLAPAVLPLLEGANLGTGAQLAGLMAASAGALATGLTENGRFVIEAFRFEARRRRPGLLGEPERVLVGMDYRARTNWNLGIAKTSEPLELSVKNAGLLYEAKPVEESGAIDVDRDIRLVFQDATAEILDPGQFEVREPLGRLLRVIAARVGSGSTWVEVDLGLALDLGIIHVSKATLRGTVRGNTVDIELRGLEVDVDVPGLLKGQGRLSVEAGQDGGLKSAINLTVVPAGIKCSASLALRGQMFSLNVSTQFSTPLPLGSSGLGIFGFQGAFVSNGTRDFTGISTDDVVRRELEWFVKNPEDKYAERPGQWALGLGTVIGTLPDQGFTFNAKAMLALEVPDLQIRLGIDGQFLSRPGPASEQGDAIDDAGGEFRLLGIVSIDRDQVALGALGTYERKKLIEVEVPLAGLFPRRGPDPFFLRVGADGFGGRSQPPVRARILPGVVDNLEGFAFLMIEEHGLANLGGSGLDFPGFAVGLGVGFELKWGNRLLGLDVAALVLAGVGRSPLTVGALVSIDGEVRFALLSAGLSAKLLMFYVRREGADHLRIEGKVCARVGVWKFKKTKCGEVGIGDEELPLDRAPSPIRGVDVVSRLDRVIGPAARQNGAAAAGATAWPDLIPVVHFDHPVRVDLTDSAFDPGDSPGPTWTGQGGLQYAYRVTAIDLRPRGGAPLDGPLPSIWAFPPGRPRFPGPSDPPAGDEAQELHLLSDHPALWGRNLLDGGAALLGNPADNLEKVCEPAPKPGRVCAPGQNAFRLGPNRVRIRPDAPSPPPYPSFFEAILRERFGNLDLGQAALQLAEAGLELVRGSRSPLSGLPSAAPELAGVLAAYFFAHIADQGQFAVSLPAELRFLPEVAEPSLVLALCGRGLVDRIGTLCDRFDNVPEGSVFRSMRHRDFTYQVSGANRFRAVRVGTKMTLRYPAEGLRIVLPERSGEVTVKIVILPADDVFATPRLTAFDSEGLQLATTTNPALGVAVAGELRVTDAGNRIVSVLLTGSGADHLIEVCYRAVVDPRVDALTAEAAQNALPRVVGTTRDGDSLPWLGTVIPHTPTIAPPPCTFVRYTPRTRDVYTRVRIGPWARSRLGLASVCGISADALRQRDSDQDARDRFIDEWNARAGADADEHPGRFLLEADTEYELVVRWEAKIFQHPRDEDGRVSDTAVPSGDPWAASEPIEGVVDFNPPAEVFSFRTAAEPSPLPAEPPADTEDESTFDPRAARRYVLRLSPDTDAPPHFPDDPVEVRYVVDHLASLMAKYGRELVVKVRRTDPPPGSLAGNGAPPLPPAASLLFDLAAIALPFEVLEAVDAGMVAVTARPGSCLNERAPEGHTAPFVFDLEARAEYDLMVVAERPQEAASPELVLARTHFRTSRHRNARELLEALGFTDPDPNPILPVEVFVNGGPPTTRRDGDGPLDEALVQLGLDPWPLSAEPRLTLLVGQADGPPLVGVLLEGPEPIERGPRVRVAAARILQSGQTAQLDLVRVSDSGTRLLFSTPDPVLIEDGAALMELELATSREGTLRGRRFIAATGLSLAGELVS